MVSWQIFSLTTAPTRVGASSCCGPTLKSRDRNKNGLRISGNDDEDDE